jgi:ribose 5-phosphate isomerase B
MIMRVAFAADHAGFLYKQELVEEFQNKGYEVLDLGTDSQNAVDYPDIAERMALFILDQRADRGVLICGSGVGVSVAANKFVGIRAGVCHDAYSAHQGVEHDNMNVICLGSRVIGLELARELVATFLQAEFSQAERHVRRLKKIDDIERKYRKKEKS